MSIVLTTFIVILLMSTSPLTGISSSTLFQDRINDITQNNLVIHSVFASSDETGDDNNGAGDEDQGGSDETGDDNNGAGDEQQLPANTALTAAPNTLINGVEQQLPANSGLSDKIFAQQGGFPTQASCEAQGAIFKKPLLYDNNFYMTIISLFKNFFNMNMILRGGLESHSRYLSN